MKNLPEEKNLPIIFHHLPNNFQIPLLYNKQPFLRWSISLFATQPISESCLADISWSVISIQANYQSLENNKGLFLKVSQLCLLVLL